MAFEFRLPDIGEGLAEAEIVEWLVQTGQEVRLDQPLVQVETDKAVIEIPAPRAGVLLHQGGEAGAVVRVGEILAVIGEAGEAWVAATRTERPEPAPIVGTLTEAPEPSARGEALPVVRKLARDLGVDLSAVRGTGPRGRITREDVEAAAGRVTGDDERVHLSRLRRTIAERMARSWREIPHVTTFAEADAARLLSIREELATEIGRPVPFEALFVGAVIPALREHPEFNATLEGDDLILKRRYDIGFAVDTADGLIVPVIKGAELLGLDALSARIDGLRDATLSRTASADELTGATFTISNIGAAGGGYGTPIIPFGTTAILSLGRATPRAVAQNERVVVAPMMPLSLSYDHRVIDGALGRRFLSMLVQNLEDPARFLPSLGLTFSPGTP
jgi:pyruvate/2-oxoglutarate dehydrogenase complex dihydrolipoamide acyltransferase (E2) component